MSLTLFDKIWARHVITHFDDGNDLLFIDRHLLHEVTSPQAFSGLLEQQRGMPFPQLTVSTEDHVVSTAPERSGASFAQGQQLLEHARINTRHFGVRHFPVDHARQGIVHVMAPEQGLVLPGMTAVCGDSHTCTLGALGCVAFGIGTSEVEHVMATQSLVQKKPANLRVVLE
ncbi:MAG: aconitase family protein, partial [Janthinobacterium sp.]